MKKSIRQALSVSVFLLSASPIWADMRPEQQIDSLNGINTPLRSVARTYQAYYASSQFASVVTSQTITGIQFRLSTSDGMAGGGEEGGAWPSQDLTFSEYTVRLSTAGGDLAAAGRYPSIFTPFSYGEGSNAVTVRSGPLTVPAGSFTDLAGDVANPYSFTIPFDLPYVFNPGDSLVLTLGVSGYSPSSEPFGYFAYSDTVTGEAAAIHNTVSGNAASANGGSNPLFVNFVTAAIPEPGGMTLGGIAGLALLAARPCRRRG